MAIPQQVGDLFIAGLARQLIDVVPPIDELAFGAEDMADSGLSDDNALKPFWR